MKLSRLPGNLFLFFLLILSAGCSLSRKIGKLATETVLADSVLQHAHVGICLYESGSGRYYYNYNSGKYFVPASNIKIVTCYAAMKYLGDSLPGLRYAAIEGGLLLWPTGDPSLLHPDFSRQPVVKFLQQTSLPLFISDKTWMSPALGAGWSWDDFNEPYMAERSPLPVYGNCLRWVQEKNPAANQNAENEFDQSVSIYSIPEVNWKVRFNPDLKTKSFFVRRETGENVFVITEGNEKKRTQDVPFITHGLQAALELLPDTLGKTIRQLEEEPVTTGPVHVIHSRPVDSVLRPMMQRSDNFFAEQLLLMVSREKLGFMQDEKITDTLLKTDLAGFPQKPRWADGSGLSRYNLFSPQDFVFILDKMRKEFGMERIKNIFATGGNGTLGNYYRQDSGFVYAKTGTLSGVVAFSGYLYTRKGKWMIVSVLVNNHRGSASLIRSKVEAFLHQIRESY